MNSTIGPISNTDIPSYGVLQTNYCSRNSTPTTNDPLTNAITDGKDVTENSIPSAVDINEEGDGDEDGRNIC